MSARPFSSLPFLLPVRNGAPQTMSYAGSAPRFNGARSRSSLDAEDGGAGGGAKNQSSMVVVKTGAVGTNGGPLVAAPDLAEDQGGDTIECSSSFWDTSSGSDGEADGGDLEVNSVISARANGAWSSKLAR